MIDAALSLLYLVALACVGWWLQRSRWNAGFRVACGMALVIFTPLLFLVPAMRNPQNQFSDLQMAMGVGMLGAGLAAMLGGFAVAWIGSRRKG